MSLIHEALRRARDETVRRDAAARGIPLAPARSSKGRSRWLVAAVMILSLALVVSLAVVARLSSRLTGRPTSAEPPAQRLAPISQLPIPPSAPAAGESTPERGRPPASHELASAGTASRPAPAPADAAPSPAVSPLDSSENRRSATPRLDSPVAAATPQDVPKTEAQSPPGSRVFVRRADLDDGNAIELGGIAWSESGPFALLNGRVVGVGESVRGYLVVEIDPGQVVLERRGQRLALRLK